MKTDDETKKKKTNRKKRSEKEGETGKDRKNVGMEVMQMKAENRRWKEKSREEE
jgi:hypothetical protein